MKIDPYKHKERFLKWKAKTELEMPHISPENAQVLREYIRDMENGFNVSCASKKGARGFIRLNVLSTRINSIMRKIEQMYSVSKITSVTEPQICDFFANMRSGKITKQDGTTYKSVRDYVKDFKSFWHWHQKVFKKQGIEIKDITTDLDTSGEKPRWVYLDEKQVRNLAENAKPLYRALIYLLFDSGIRAPTELMNIKVSDFKNDFKELQIREETSKTFGRRIKLMISSEVIRDFVRCNNLSEDDYLFTRKPYVVNRYLKKLSGRLFGDRESEAGQKYSQLTMYDLRHCSCCYWLPIYKSESALKYRFGWKKSDKIHYYSEMLGMKDTISEDDLLVDVTKTQIEQELTMTKKQNEILTERLRLLEIQVVQIGQLTKRLFLEVVPAGGINEKKNKETGC